MTHEERVKQAMAAGKQREPNEFVKQQYTDRDYHIRVYSNSKDFSDWSGSSFAGRNWSGAWANGRER